MIRLMFMTVLSVFAATSSSAEQVCVFIDEWDTHDDKHPNQARRVDDHMQYFNVFHKKEACFDLDKQYYMQYFLYENSRVIMYGTRCRYEPKLEHAGKVLRYEGNSGSTLCPIVDEFNI